jgi:hypothetical protein
MGHTFAANDKIARLAGAQQSGKIEEDHHK